MVKFLGTIILSLLLGSANAVTKPDWKLVGGSPISTIEVDLTSMVSRQKDGGQEVWSRLRVKFFREITLLNKKKALYAINEVTSICSKDALLLSTVTFYSKDGKIVDTGDKPTLIPNPHDPDSFITTFLNYTCHHNRKVDPELIV